MIEINSVMRGRLGNQMFQYTFARWIKMNCKDSDSEINIFFGNFNNELRQFSLKCNYLDSYPKRTPGQKASMAFVNRLCRKNEYKDLNRYEGLLNSFGVYWNFDNKSDLRFVKKNNYLLYGWFENSRWGKELGSSLKEEFTPSFDVLPENLDFYGAIKETNSVCIHARLYDDEYNRIPDEKNYYQRAVRKMQETVKDPVFFIFTNKRSWAEDMLEPEKWGSEYHFEPVFNDGKKRPPAETLRLMYSCRHYIISVSTFSWWAQQIGDAEDKVVIAPKLLRKGITENTMTDPSWIRV